MTKDIPLVEENQRVVIIGIDCATDPKNIGLAHAIYAPAGKDLTIEDVQTKDGKEGSHSDGLVDARRWTAVIAQVREWIGFANWEDWTPPVPILFALDSPLGWPAVMGPALSGHFAGQPVQSSDAFLAPDTVGTAAHMLFRRYTDRVVAGHCKTPLDVGADKIARVAHTSLWLLARLRREFQHDISLAWEPGCVSEIQAIEVYPAATLEARGLMESGYKSDRSGRRTILKKMLSRRRRDGSGALMTIGGGDRSAVRDEATRTDHVLDAVICCLAGADFLTGEVIVPKPEQRTLAEKEGWIWVWA